MMPIEQLYQFFLKCDGISTDSRTVKPGNLFFALKGENFNGNQYAQQALDKGAKFAVIDEAEYAINSSHFIIVPDVLQALQNVANHHRKQFDFPVIGLTGSNGKTTTKELITAVLSAKYEVAATKGNLNNHIGVPLTLLTLQSSTEIAVIEMGANHIGEIKQLCEIAEPNYGLITTIGKAHLEGFGSTEGVRKAKMELFDFLVANKGFAFINGDQQEILDVAPKFDFDKKTSYGQSPFADVLGMPIKGSNQAALLYQNRKIETRLFGQYNFINLLAAIAVGQHFDVSLNDMQQAIKSYVPTNKRSQIIETTNNTIILDAYNANPSSMQIAIEEFANQQNIEESIVVVGDMLELGTYEQEEHLHIIQLIEKLNFKIAYFVGEIFYKFKDECAAFTFFEDTTALIDHLKNAPPKGNHILIKGSRKIKLEQLVACL